MFTDSLVMIAPVRGIVKRSSTPIRADAGRFVYLSADELDALRREVVRRAAELRPGPGATAAGVTPKWYRERVAQLDALRERLRAAEAAGVGE